VAATRPAGQRAARRDHGSSASNPSITRSTAKASSAPRANTVTQSRLGQAGTTPRVLTNPRVGLTPTSSQKASGTRPDPAVSVPRAKETRPVAVASAEPELDPPVMIRGSWGLRQAPYALRVPTNPVAN